MTPTFNAIGVVVADMGKALAFYRRLGLDIPLSADSEPHVEAALPGGMRLMFDTVDTILSFDPSWTPPKGGQRVGFAFECESADEVNAVYAELVEAGYEGHLPPFDAEWGQRYASIGDPDGNGVDLYATLPTR